jgi:2'-5' RNA ligase
LGKQFIAVVPNGLDKKAEMKQLLGKLKRTAEGRGQEARWTPSSLWHVTLQFLGEVKDSGKVRKIMDEWTPPPLELRLHGLGAFPSPDEGRVLWIGVQESQAFLDTQADLARRLADAGFRPDPREYKPHLTLARFRNLSNLSDLIQLGGRKHFGDYPIGEIVLFESVLQGNIIKYVPQYRKSLNSDNPGGA